jgi:hypothetical protein
MKAKTVRYEKKFNLGNYETEVVGIELELNEGEKASDALALAKKFVEKAKV